MQIAENLRHEIKAQTDSFLSIDDDTNLMTIHVRQGNGEIGDFYKKATEKLMSYSMQLKVEKKWKCIRT